MKLEEGQEYRVVKGGAHLSVPRSTGRFSWRFEQRELIEGETITYVGRKDGIGHDTVPVDAFKTEDGTVGRFWPNDWGRADRSFLEEVDS